MAKILHVSNFGRQPKGAFLHGVEYKISNGLVRNGHQVINFSDRDAAREHSWFGRRRAGGERMANRDLRKLCSEMRPDVIFLGHADIISPDTVDCIRRYNPAVRVLQWNVDPIFDRGNVDRLKNNLEVVDATLASTAGEALSEIKNGPDIIGFLPNPVDLSIEKGRNHEHETLPFDLFYACGHPSQPLREICGATWDMNAFFAELMRELPGLRALLPGVAGSPNLAGAAYQDALEQAAIGLNISRRDDQYLYSSDRLAQMCGNGQAILIARTTGYASLFSDEEMIFFESLAELVEGIARLVREPQRRMRIAAAGRNRYHALFNERRIAQYMLDVALGQFNPADYTWPTLLS
jgi:hypothetical protein